MKKGMAIVLGLLGSAAVQAATIHVPADQPSIAAGLAAAGAGDTVLVACGVYAEWDLGLPSGVTLRGETGIGDCVTIDAGGNSRALLLVDTGAGTRIEGLVITGGSFTSGPAIYFWNAAAEVNDCRIVGNVGGGYGGAIYFRESGADVVLNGCWFEGNVAGEDGGAIYGYGGSSLVVNGCTFVDNHAYRDGGAVALYAIDADFTACTFAANGCDVRASAIVTIDAAASLERCLFTDGLTGGAVFAYGSGTFACSCTDIYGNAGGDWSSDVVDQLGSNGNISEDPLYCDAPGGDLTLRSSSPCTSANSPCGLHIGAWDQGCTDTAAARASWSQVKSLY